MSVLKQITRLVLALSAGTAALSLNDRLTVSRDGFTSQAAARIGRPATPLSYAGVARRTTRRAVGYGAAGAAAAGAYYHYNAGAGCAQVVNSYGQIVYQCP
jgi:hypothetical protein